jgi:hypothetical protein
MAHEVFGGRQLLAGLALLTLLFSPVLASKPKGASLTVRARFNATSYLLEALEFLVRWAMHFYI